jgi:hypothetical protein
MTVRDLKKEMEKYPDDTLVVVDAYEFGYDTPKIRPGSIIKTKIEDKESYIGSFIDYEEKVHKQGTIPIPCVIIKRNSN